MPPVALVDPSTFDTSRVVADREAIRLGNPQRFEMEQLTAIIYLDAYGTPDHRLQGRRARRVLGPRPHAGLPADARRPDVRGRRSACQLLLPRDQPGRRQLHRIRRVWKRSGSAVKSAPAIA